MWSGDQNPALDTPVDTVTAMSSGSYSFAVTVEPTQPWTWVVGMADGSGTASRSVEVLPQSLEAQEGAPGVWLPEGTAPPWTPTKVTEPITAVPNTAWSTGSYVTGSGGSGGYYWDGTAWQNGIAP